MNLVWLIKTLQAFISMQKTHHNKSIIHHMVMLNLAPSKLLINRIHHINKHQTKNIERSNQISKYLNWKKSYFLYYSMNFRFFEIIELPHFESGFEIEFVNVTWEEICDKKLITLVNCEPRFAICFWIKRPEFSFIFESTLILRVWWHSVFFWMPNGIFTFLSQSSSLSTHGLWFWSMKSLSQVIDEETTQAIQRSPVIHEIHSD